VFLEQPIWTDVLKIAKEQNKPIFLYCYTVWCGPCRALSTRVFPQPEVGEFFNANFINVKYDMEKGEGIELRNRYRPHIIGFPTMLLIDKNGEVIHQMAGFKEPAELITGMKSGLEGRSLSALRAKYAAGNRNIEFLTNYAAALSGASLRSELEAMAIDYMESIPLDSIFSPKNWAILHEHIRNPFSPQFEHTLRNLTRLARKPHVDIYNLERQMHRTLDRTVDRITRLQRNRAGDIQPLYNNRDTINRLKGLINIAHLRRAETQRALLHVHELKLDGKWEEALIGIDYYSQIRALGFSNRFANETIQYIAENTNDKAILNRCLAMIKDIQQREDRGERAANFYNTLAMLYRKTGDYANAEKSQVIYEERRRQARDNWDAMVERQNESEDENE
jgi:thiol-disulfide isomerase/thioredoxin